MPNYADPNIDFGLEQELLIKALKEAEGQRATRLPNDGTLVDLGGGARGYRIGSGAGGQIAAGLDRIVGNITKPQVEQNMRDLRGEETRRYDELTRQMNEPGTVDYENPDELAADNTRRMGIAGQMSKLPMAQKMAQTYLSKGASFPETLALLKAKQIEAGQQNAVRLQAAQEQQAARLAQQQSQAEMNNQLRLMGLGIQQQNADTARERAQRETPTEAKAKLQAEDRAEAKKRGDSLLNEMETNIDILDKNAGITNPERSALRNAVSWAQNTPPGQVLGKVGGTTNQNARNNIESLATNLVLELKNIKGLGASQMNSNMELQRYLTAVAGGNNYDAKSLKDVVRRARDMLGSAPSGGGDTGGAGGEVRSFGGKNYVLKPGADSKLRSSWVEQ
jgi:hypothetical protein